MGVLTLDGTCVSLHSLASASDRRERRKINYRYLGERERRRKKKRDGMGYRYRRMMRYTVCRYSRLLPPESTRQPSFLTMGKTSSVGDDSNDEEKNLVRWIIGIAQKRLLLSCIDAMAAVCLTTQYITARRSAKAEYHADCTTLILRCSRRSTLPVYLFAQFDAQSNE